MQAKGLVWQKTASAMVKDTGRCLGVASELPSELPELPQAIYHATEAAAPSFAEAMQEKKAS
jgi:hypothetical protein